jgi:hypothetical protein
MAVCAKAIRVQAGTAMTASAAVMKVLRSIMVSFRHCEEPTGPAFGRPDDKLRDEAIQSFLISWIASLRS